MDKQFGKTIVRLELGDITKARTDAIVNAANPSLMGGGGVDGAIHHSGGPAILKDCKRIIDKVGKLQQGRAVVTNAGRLHAKYVIHTVGPIWRGGSHNEARVLASAYRESLLMADNMAIKTVSFPSISTGAFGYPVSEAAEIALTTVKSYLEQESYLERVDFILFTRETFIVYEQVLQTL